MLATVSHDAFDAERRVGNIAVLQRIGGLVIEPPQEVVDSLLRDWIA
jgi:hypothetical protein